MRVTLERLIELDACAEGRKWFVERWPNGCGVTMKFLTAVGEEYVDWLGWFARKYLRDGSLVHNLTAVENQIRRGWNEGVGNRLMSLARQKAENFLSKGYSEKETMHWLKFYRKNYLEARKQSEAVVGAKLARMVYDHVKSETAEKKRKRK